MKRPPRHEHLIIIDASESAASPAGKVAIVEPLGNSTLIYVDTPAGRLIVEGAGNLVLKGGNSVGLKLDEPHARLFGADGATI